MDEVDAGTPARRLGRARGFHDPGEYRDLAASPTVTADDLLALSTSDHPFVREVVARNPRTPTDVLEGLIPDEVVTDQQKAMLRSLAQNPALPESAIRRVAWLAMTEGADQHGPGDPGLLLGLFRRSDVPIDLLLDLLDAPEATRAFVIEVARETTRTRVREVLLTDARERVRRAASTPRRPG